ncbi:Crp/Fnr family transcriptional regulator [Lagierella sp.]|uniref:Crp/Fnr family transcriptional regulator n=1 Tax=Lagierella sp. TaxID=2849657 RepID=UPI00262913FD|nr:Crp/Fnr family transcriptional regulator [Lagierella sp.]
MATRSDLFLGLSNEEIDEFILKSGGLWSVYKKGEVVFSQGEVPEFLFILDRGSVVVENISLNGQRSIVNRFTKPGTVFGEVYLYLSPRAYDYSCVADVETRICKIPKNAFLMENEEFHNSKVINNMLLILSQKAFYLNQKLLVQSAKTLREKLSRFFLMRAFDKNVDLEFNREELADFLGATRPSISREIMKMQREDLIEIKGSKILIHRDKLKKFL